MKQIPIINKFVQELNPFQEALEKCRLAFLYNILLCILYQYINAYYAVIFIASS
ncbi:alkaline protease secretion, ATP-binding domain protein [Orientia tsutsugamushi str. Gilliam]|uniref:Alkaline protease secretion, ATP-binding domain protein n=1 Tax=Orientia tsutsugamushi str. Gilliam TaxID=1359184 RepID=A0A0F3MDM9_ORITS|nr:alkaline protease secretion, ATP-binding domain protein [Orientia tsutsugamushi str. Gilliam]